MAEFSFRLDFTATSYGRPLDVVTQCRVWYGNQLAAMVRRTLKGRGKKKAWQVRVSLGHVWAQFSAPDFREYCTALCDAVDGIPWPTSGAALLDNRSHPYGSSAPDAVEVLAAPSSGDSPR